MKPNEKEIMEDFKSGFHRSIAPIEAYFMMNACFLPDDHILKNAHKISHIPTSIVHGRFDAVCPPENAYELHKRMKNSRLSYTIAGHSASEEETKKKLIEELNYLSSNR